MGVVKTSLPRRGLSRFARNIYFFMSPRAFFMSPRAFFYVAPSEARGPSAPTCGGPSALTRLGMTKKEGAPREDKKEGVPRKDKKESSA